MSLEGIIAANAVNQARAATNKADEAAEIAALACNKIDALQSWEAGRFNDMVDGFHKVLDKLDALQEQVAALQKRLYEAEKQNHSRGFGTNTTR